MEKLLTPEIFEQIYEHAFSSNTNADGTISPEDVGCKNYTEMYEKLMAEHELKVINPELIKDEITEVLPTIDVYLNHHGEPVENAYRVIENAVYDDMVLLRKLGYKRPEE